MINRRENMIFNLVISRELRASLDKLAEKRMCSTGEVIRDILTEHMQEREEVSDNGK